MEYRRSSSPRSPSPSSKAAGAPPPGSFKLPFKLPSMPAISNPLASVRLPQANPLTSVKLPPNEWAETMINRMANSVGTALALGVVLYYAQVASTIYLAERQLESLMEQKTATQVGVDTIQEAIQANMNKRNELQRAEQALQEVKAKLEAARGKYETAPVEEEAWFKGSTSAIKDAEAAVDTLLDRAKAAQEQLTELEKEVMASKIKVGEAKGNLNPFTRIIKWFGNRG